MKIIIADDHMLFLDGLGHVLHQLAPDPTLVEASDYNSLTAVIAEHGDADLALVDLDMPGGERLSALRTVLQNNPTLPVVVLSASENPEDMRQALDLGAMGYIPKRESVPVILGAIRLVLSGGIYVPPILMQTKQSAPSSTERALTPRQRDVLYCLLDGKTNKEIARDLALTEATVKAHVSAIFRALGINHRNQVARAAERLGLAGDRP